MMTPSLLTTASATVTTLSLRKWEDSIKALKRVGMTQAHLAPMFGADPLVMRAMLNYLTKRYGTVEAYLAHIGISAHQRTRIREHLLMEPATLAQQLPHP
jgi:CMP-2-keto-3-deoxyoctulosonic acid synthetase